MDVDEDTLSSSAAQPKGGEEKTGSKVHVLGIGGRRTKRTNVRSGGSRKTPGEIRIQKGEDLRRGVQHLKQPRDGGP